MYIDYEDDPVRISKTRVTGLSCGICMVLHLAVFIQYQSVTDTHTHTHTQTDGHTTTEYPVLSIASHGKNLSRDVTTPLSGTVCRPLAGISLYTKYKVSTFTHYEDMKGYE